MPSRSFRPAVRWHRTSHAAERGQCERGQDSQLLSLGHELAGDSIMSMPVSQTCRPPLVPRPRHYAAFHAIRAVVPRFVHKSVHKPRDPITPAGLTYRHLGLSWQLGPSHYRCGAHLPAVTPKTRRRSVQAGIRDLLVSGPLGFGTAPLGNMFRDIPDQEAEATVDAAWGHGTRYFDTAPM